LPIFLGCFPGSAEPDNRDRRLRSVLGFEPFGLEPFSFAPGLRDIGRTSSGTRIMLSGSPNNETDIRASVFPNSGLFFHSRLRAASYARSAARIGLDGRETTVRACGRIHIGSPSLRPNSVLKLSSNPPRSVGALGFANAQDNVARAFLSGRPRGRASDQARAVASCLGRRPRAGSTHDSAGICTERIGEVRSAAAARCAHGERDCGAVSADDRRGTCIGRPRDDQQGRGTALGGCQRHGRVAASRSQSQAIEENCRQICFHGKNFFHGKTRGLALPTGRRGRPFEVTQPLASMQFVEICRIVLNLARFCGPYRPCEPTTGLSLFSTVN
jgi:hypothetical protein